MFEDTLLAERLAEGLACDSPSLSMSHNSAERSAAELQTESSGQAVLPFRLTGSQKKTAYALKRNAKVMIEEAGVEAVVFVTFTLGERNQWGEWDKVFDAGEAAKQFNTIARWVLPRLFEKWIVVTERDREGGIHFHMLAVVAGRPDVRTGFDFSAVADGDYSSASDPLQTIWRALRAESVKKLGFGRIETLPIKSVGEAVAAYVSKYIEKNICNRLKADKGKKLVRYGRWAKDSEGNATHLRPNDFSWATPAACQWRRQARAIARTQGILDKGEMRAKAGPRWAYHLTAIMTEGVFLSDGGNDARGIGSADECGEWEWYRRGGLDGREWAQESFGRLLVSYAKGRLEGAPKADAAKSYERPLSDAEWQELLDYCHLSRLEQLTNGNDFGEDEEEAARAWERLKKPCEKEKI